MQRKRRPAPKEIVTHVRAQLGRGFERQQAQERLQREEQRFCALSHHTCQFIGALSPEGVLLEANQTALDFRGLSAVEVLGRPFWETPWWSYSSTVQKQLRAAIKQAASGKFIRYEVEAQGKGGELRMVDLSLKPILDKSGSVVLLIPEGRDISDIKQTEKELRESEERFRQAFMHSAIGIGLVSPKGGWLKVNPALCRLTGYAEKQLLKTKFQALTHPDDLAKDLRIARQLLSGKIRSTEWEKRYIHKRGHEIWVSISVSLLRDELKTPLYFITQIQDITERKQTVDQLQLMSKVFKDSSDPILIEDLSGCITDLNKAAEQCYGWKRAQLLGQSIKVIIPPEHHEQTDKLLDRCKQGETVRDTETARWTKAHQKFPVLVTLSRLMNSAGETVAVASIVKDISALKKVEATLQKKDSLLQLLQEITALANEARSIEGAMQQALEFVCRYTGWCVGHVYLPSEVSSDTLTSSALWYMEDDTRFGPFRVRTEKLGAVPKDELASQVFASSEPGWVSDLSQYRPFVRAGIAKRLRLKAAFAFPVLSQQRSVAVMEFFSNRRQELENDFLKVMAHVGVQLGRVFERAQAEKKLTESERLTTMGVTTAKLVHEISNPLNGMSTTVQILERHLAAQNGVQDETLQSSLHDLANEIGRLRSLLIELRSLTRPKDLQLQPTDLRILVQEFLALEEAHYEKAGVRVQIEFPSSLAPVLADAEKLKQVLMNLCHNAVEAMPKGGKLTLAAHNTRNNGVTLDVCDTGTGIPENIDIFELFTTTKPEGTGLGLPIVRQIVDAHGGTLSHQSTPGKGTLFRVLLPACLTKQTTHP
ncbi:MAG: PAS domain S-box protein [Candidatus Binatia bacterium]